VTTYMEEESRRSFEANRATYMRNWPYAYALAKDSQIADSFDVTTFPPYEGNPGAGVLGGYNLAISAYSENPEGSLAFIEYAVRPDQQEIQATEASLPAVVSKVYDMPSVKKALPFATDLRDAVEQAQPRPVSPVYPQISEAIYTNVYAALQGEKSPDQAAQDMNADIQDALETF
jgi:multiple sugar transport system substrate-binding protein